MLFSNLRGTDMEKLTQEKKPFLNLLHKLWLQAN